MCILVIARASGRDKAKNGSKNIFLLGPPRASFTENNFGPYPRPGVFPGRERSTATGFRYLGFIWALDAKTVEFPPDKLAALLSLDDEWRVPGARFSLNDIALFHGKLVHTSKAARIIRLFVPSASHFSESSTTHTDSAFHPFSSLKSNIGLAPIFDTPFDAGSETLAKPVLLQSSLSVSRRCGCDSPSEAVRVLDQNCAAEVECACVTPES